MGSWSSNDTGDLVLVKDIPGLSEGPGMHPPSMEVANPGGQQPPDKPWVARRLSSGKPQRTVAMAGRNVSSSGFGGLTAPVPADMEGSMGTKAGLGVAAAAFVSVTEAAVNRGLIGGVSLRISSKETILMEKTAQSW